MQQHWLNLSACVTQFKNRMATGHGFSNGPRALRDISHLLMRRYNWIRPHQSSTMYSRQLWPKKNLTSCPVLFDHYSLAPARGSIRHQCLQIFLPWLDIRRFRPRHRHNHHVRIYFLPDQLGIELGQDCSAAYCFPVLGRLG